jgi:hypothetical protein
VTAPFTDDQVDRAIDFVISGPAIDRARTVRYTAVFEAAGLAAPQDLQRGGDSDTVTAFMKRFHDRCVERGLPPLDALVVHVAGAREGRPGGGCFRVNGHVDPFAEQSSASAEASRRRPVLLGFAAREVKALGGTATSRDELTGPHAGLGDTSRTAGADAWE